MSLTDRALYRYNVIPEDATLLITIRTYATEVRGKSVSLECNKTKAASFESC